jgi:hypothetical protein
VRFLADQDVYVLTLRFLRDLGHDVVTAAELGLSRAADTDLLSRAAEQGRILATVMKTSVLSSLRSTWVRELSYFASLRPPWMRHTSN